MDVKLPGWIALFGGCMLALGLAARPVAADDSEMVIITSTDDDVAIAADDSGAPAEPAEPSDLVFHIADDAPTDLPPPHAMSPRALEFTAPDASGAAIAADEARNAEPIGRMIVDSEVVPARHVGGKRSSGLNWGGVLGAGPRRPAPSAGINAPQRTGRYEAAPGNGSHRSAALETEPPINDAPPAYEAPAYDAAEEVPQLNMAAHRAPAASAKKAPTVKSPLDHAKKLLVDAYELSLHASTEAEYSQIIQRCASAGRVQLDAETSQFSTNLSAWALNRRGQVRADEGQTDLALSDFRAALDLSPNNWRALHNRAVTFAQRGEFAQSFDDVCRVIQLNPKFAKALANRATLYVQASDYDRALLDYNAALAVEPSLLAALVGHGRVCHMQGKLDDALASLDAAVKIAPKDADIVCSRADLLADLGRYEDALLDYAQAIDLNSKFEHAYRNGAWLLATCPDESIRDAEGALAGAQAALNCGYGERHAALDTMAAALANAGRFEEAVGTIQQAIEIAPENVHAVYQARQQLYEAGQPFRTHPVGAIANAADGPPEEAQSAVYIEQ